MDPATLSPDIASAATGRAASGGKDTAGELRENFMSMLVTQLRNQDPLNPLENNQLTSQLAQVSTVSGVDALNETLDGINSQIEAGQSLQAAALIDRGVLVPGEHVMVGTEGVSTPFGVELNEPAETLTTKIIGPGGEVLHSEERKHLEAGVHSLGWDGEIADGETAAPGAYSVEFEATAPGGQVIEAESLAYGVVSGVNMAGGTTRLDLGGVADPVTLSDVRQIL